MHPGGKAKDLRQQMYGTSALQDLTIAVVIPIPLGDDAVPPLCSI